MTLIVEWLPVAGFVGVWWLMAYVVLSDLAHVRADERQRRVHTL